MTNKYYVYAILDPRKLGDYKYFDFKFEYQPFYIGKGTKRRLVFTGARNSFCENKIVKIKKEVNTEPIIRIIKGNLSEDDAFALEIKLIKSIGRKGCGPLTNITDGGEGVSGHTHTEESKEKMRQSQIGKKHTEEHKRKISEGNKGKFVSEESKARMRKAQANRLPISEETREKMRKNSYSFYGKKHTEESIEKMKISQKKRKNKVHVLIKDGIHIVTYNLHQFSLKNQIPSSSMARLARGLVSEYKGYSILKEAV